jgi:hypothetical protein
MALPVQRNSEPKSDAEQAAALAAPGPLQAPDPHGWMHRLS